MMLVPDDFRIKCKKCKQVMLVYTDGLECDTAVYERSMGAEIEYNFSGEICCENCNSWIDFVIKGFEYPVGAFNFSGFECHGGEFVDEPRVEMAYEFDEDYDEYVYDDYIKAESVLEYHRAQIENMSPREFELFVGNIFERMGFNVRITQPTRDGGRDIIATKAKPLPYTLIVECKHWGKRHKVDVSVIRSVFGVQTATQANQSVVVTSSKFTRDARKFAAERENLMTLWDIDDLLALL